MSLSTNERVITIKHATKCRLCKELYMPGSKVIWSPTTGVRCVETDQVGGDDQCIGRFFEPGDGEDYY